MKTIESLSKKEVENSLVKFLSVCQNVTDCILMKELIHNTIWIKEVLPDEHVQAYKILIENQHNSILEKQLTNELDTN